MWWWLAACWTASGPPVPAWVGGCAAWPGEACAVDGRREVVVWLPEGGAVRGAEVAAAPSGAGGVARVDVAPGDVIEVVAEGRAPLRVEVVALPPAWDGAGLPEAGGPGWEEAVLARGEAGGALGRGLARRVLLRGAPESPRRGRWLDEAVAAFREAGRADLAVGVLLQQVYGLAVEGGSMAEARRLLAEARGWSVRSLEVAGHLAWAEGLLAKRTGDLRAAAVAYREAVGRYSDAGLADAATARNGLAEVEQRAGRHREALALFAATAAEARTDAAPPGCWWSFALNDLAFALQVARRAGYTGPVDGWPEASPAGLLAQGLAAWTPACDDAQALALTLHLNQAQVAAEEGRLDEGRRALAEARRLLGAEDRANALAAALVEGQLALAARDAEGALRAWAQAEALALRVDPVLGRMEALVGQALALDALGRPEEALARHVDADEVARNFARFVPLFAGRDTFLAQRDRSARHRVSLLLRAERPAEAMAVVRRQRAAVLADLAASRRLDALGPEARARWDAAVESFEALRGRLDAGAQAAWALPADELAAWTDGARRLRAEAEAVLDGALSAGGGSEAPLRAPGDGELMVAWFEAMDGWVGLWSATDGAGWWRIGALPEAPEERGEALFGPLKARLPGQRRVTLLPWGALRDTDLHLLPLDGAPALSKVPMAWALDVGGPGGGAGGPAWLVADPRGDLPAARAEGDAVSAATGARGLRGPEATRAAVLGALSEAGLWHYAGHGAVDALGGARLLLADEGELSVADVLSLPRVPGRVVLLGCETGRAGEASVEGLGLGQAFVVAGAVAAVASVRPVEDVVAGAVASALYEAGFVGGDEAAAFQRAALAVPGAGAVRLYVR